MHHQLVTKGLDALFIKIGLNVCKTRVCSNGNENKCSICPVSLQNNTISTMAIP